MGVTTVALIDTDSDPDLVDLPIPGNDDSIRSIELILQQLADAVLEGKAARTKGAINGRPAGGRGAAGLHHGWCRRQRRLSGVSFVPPIVSFMFSPG